MCFLLSRTSPLCRRPDFTSSQIILLLLLLARVDNTDCRGMLHRRASAGGLEGLTQPPPGAELGGGPPPGPAHPALHRRPHSSMSGKLGQARSWANTPFTSDTEAEQEGEHHFFKEEKKVSTSFISSTLTLPRL